MTPDKECTRIQRLRQSDTTTIKVSVDCDTGRLTQPATESWDWACVLLRSDIIVVCPFALISLKCADCDAGECLQWDRGVLDHAEHDTHP